MPEHDTADILMQPLRIGSIEIKNRIVAGPMAVLAPEKDGRPSDQTIAYLAERAKGGVGMIIAGAGVPNPEAAKEVIYEPISRAYTDDCVPGLKRVADSVHAHGVPIFAEIVSGFGRMAAPKEGVSIAASAVGLHIPESGFPQGIASPGGRTMPAPREATIEEIQQRVRSVGHSAQLIKQAGWDGIEIAAHMSYFESSFLTPRINKRTDQYGGSTENRARILVEMVRSVRAAVGPDMPIGLRITCNEHVEGGQGPEEYAAIAQIVEHEGLAYVALSVGCYESMQIGLKAKAAGVIQFGEAEIFKRRLKCPIMIPGLHDPHEAAAAIAAGLGDMTMLARPLLADPDYANKVRERRYGEIVRCNEDNYCIRRLMLNLPMRCKLNPRMGLESTNGVAPLKRVIEVPLEQTMLALAGSRTFMGMMSSLSKKAH